MRLNVVIQVVGSRGDVQPFIALGNELQTHGHRVRLATHDVFADFVRSSGLEFFPVGGDPAELMAYMVKNPGLIPSVKSLRAGDIQKKRRMVADMLKGFWASCIDADPLTETPFVADAIIANPPSFAHIHCAQALGVPLHLMFTMPWSSTRMFSHPLANVDIKGSLIEKETANYVSYGVVEWMTWQGLGDVINEWRATIDLGPVPMTEGPLLAETLKIPFTYCWSPALVPKPLDWPNYIDVCGFFFRDPPTYQPPHDLAEFLRAGSEPIYIGFGSIVIEDPKALTETILGAVRETGVRAIVSRGWSNLGGEGFEDDNVFYLGDCPHEWLFRHVKAVIHHGGAGTTACGLLNGRPTTIVPFFGDQPFWGEMVAARGAGPKPIPHKRLNRENLAEAIRFCLTPGASIAAEEIAAKMRQESGVKQAVASFHRNLPRDLRCDILPDQPAAWQYARKAGKSMKISKLAADILAEHLKVDRKKLHSIQTKPIIIENRRWDPITGTTAAAFGNWSSALTGAANIVAKPDFDAIKKGHDEANNRGCGSTALAMAKGSASGLGDFFKYFGKSYIDIPVAFADGLHAVPRLYGEEPRDYGRVTDWKSGAVVAGKSFVGMGEGMADLFVKPVQGAKSGGAVGAVTGVGKGFLSFSTKVASGAIGVAAYPLHGAYLSIRDAVKSGTRAHIAGRKMVEGGYIRRRTHDAGLEKRVLDAFDDLR
ncbi:sterol glucosyltransferase [Thozetella sp. PMI_491]|nr:sterol glucosyltransferase [Thozetella sp. PMI_491]